MKEDGSPVAKGKGPHKRQLNSKYVMNDGESDTEKQVKNHIFNICLMTEHELE